MTIKYAVFPGTVHSINDGDLHFISAPELMRLYRVDPSECIVIHPDNPRALRGFNASKLINLAPRYSGNYAIKKA